MSPPKTPRSALSREALLMIVDLQKAIDDPSWGVRNNPDAEDRIAELLAAWRKRGMPILHVRHMSTHSTSTYRPGQPGNEFKSAARPHPGEETLEKDTHSAFVRTGLEERLRERGIEEIVIVGVITNNSVEATARMSGNLGFETYVVADATYTFGRQDYFGRERSADDVHAMSLANLNGEYATVQSSYEIKALLPSG